MATDQILKIHGGQIFTRTWEVKNTLPVIMLHDSLGCVDTWRDFPEKLSAKLNHTVIAYDRLGFGKSSARDELPSLQFIQEEAKVIEALCQELNITEYILFGYSVGGAMALLAAIDNKFCKAVISESAQAFIEEQTRHGILEAIEFYKDPERFDKLKKYHGDKTAWVFHAWTDIWLSEPYANWSLLSHLTKVLCPVLVIHGDKDEYGSLAFPDSIATTVSGPTTKAIIKNCGHIPHREHQDEVLSLIEKFVTDVCR